MGIKFPTHGDRLPHRWESSRRSGPAARSAQQCLDAPHSYSTIDARILYRCFGPESCLPQDYDCTFSAFIGKTVRQQFFVNELRPARDRPKVISVLEDGSNLDDAVEDAKRVLTRQGLPFMTRWDKPDRAFKMLLTKHMTKSRFGRAAVVFPGNPGSLAWQEVCRTIGGLVQDDPATAMATAPVLNRQ